MIQLDSIEKRYGPQVLYTDLSWHITKNERVGLVGPNGAGKTTLVRILAGQEQPDTGHIRGIRRATIGYLPQEVHELPSGSILEQAMSGHAEAFQLEKRMHALAQRMAGSLPRLEAEALTRDYGELQDRFAAMGGYDLETRAKSILTGLGFDPAKLDRPVSTLSGGWQMRVALARLLLTDPDLLLLDEPTNHLDLQSLEWVEEFLRNREGAYVVISHDRYFLNRMVDRIAELSGGKLNLFTGNYDGYVVERERRFAAVQAAARNQAREVERMTRFIDRFRYSATKARQVQSRIKMLEKMEKIDAPVRDRASVHFSFPQPPRSGATVMDLQKIVKRYGDLAVYDGVDFRLQRGDRVALVGPNGAGKTTLLKILAGTVSLEGGVRHPGHNVQLAYYAQHTLDALHPENTVLGEISAAAGIKMQPQLRGILAAFLFDSDEWQKRVAVLSGGEKARLALAKLLLRPANLLLLDEPTNHLDLRSRDVLERALSGYTGTLCFISHDRFFINRTATSICAVEHGKLESYAGNYDEYRRSKAERAKAAAPTAPPKASRRARTQRSRIRSRGQDRPEDRSPEPIRRPPAPASRPKTREEKRREAESRQRFSILTRDLKDQIEKVENRIAQEEKKLRLVEYELASSATYKNPQKARSAAVIQADLKKRIADLTGRWERLTEELDRAEERFKQEVGPA
ncbi:MAG: ribosomal protection-like ABC-F family protein [Acidobacteriota bacterium]